MDIDEEPEIDVQHKPTKTLPMYAKLPGKVCKPIGAIVGMMVVENERGFQVIRRCGEAIETVADFETEQQAEKYVRQLLNSQLSTQGAMMDKALRKAAGAVLHLTQENKRLRRLNRRHVSNLAVCKRQRANRLRAIGAAISAAVESRKQLLTSAQPSS